MLKSPLFWSLLAVVTYSGLSAVQWTVALYVAIRVSIFAARRFHLAARVGNIAALADVADMRRAIDNTIWQYRQIKSLRKTPTAEMSDIDSLEYGRGGRD